MKLKAAALLGIVSIVATHAFAQTDWPTFGHDPGGQRYSPLTQITPKNVNDLSVAWVYHMKPADAPAVMPSDRGPGGPGGPGAPPTGAPPAANSNAAAQALAEGVSPAAARRPSRFLSAEETPIVAGGLMYISTPYMKVTALNPTTGTEVWNYTVPATTGTPPVTSGIPSWRGVEYWPGDGVHPAEVLFGTRDGLLIALDAKTGKGIPTFGTDGVIDMRTPEIMSGFTRGFGMTSPPIVYKNLIITGSAVQETPSFGPYGDVRAWDAVTGKLVWTFHSVARPGEPGHDTWSGNDWEKRSGNNVWGFLTVDAARGIVYLPFGAPAWDRYGADRPGNNLYDTSLVAADANTGKMLWYFQVVHHDIWDYDLEAPPALFDIKQGSKSIPAVAIVSKSSEVFFLNRVTGKPIYPIEERPVPKSDTPGEVASPTQPFAVVTEPIARQNFTPADLVTADQTTPEHAAFCKALVEDNKMVYGPVFTPVAFQKTLISFPGAIGGANWGGVSFDPKNSMMYVNTQDLGQLEGLFPVTGRAYPYALAGNVTGRFWDPSDRMPCQQTPWGRLFAINVNTGKIAWQVPLGITDTLPEGKQKTGRPNIGGSIVTAGGLVFIGATDDNRFRAFDAKTGAELWVAKLAAGANVVPATYQGSDGKQYVVVVSAGNTFLGDPPTDDSVTAFSLAH